MSTCGFFSADVAKECRQGRSCLHQHCLVHGLDKVVVLVLQVLAQQEGANGFVLLPGE